MTDTYDLGKDDTGLALDQWYRYVYMRDNGHLDFLRKADKCEDFFQGLQWREEDLARLRDTKRPALTINKIISTLATIFGEQIMNRMEVTFRPTAGASSEHADVHNKVWTNIANANQLSWLRSDVFSDGLIRSRGFYDARMNFDTNMMGNVQITKLNSKNVLIDPDAADYDPDEWNDVIISKWLTPTDIEVVYGKEVADELRSKNGSAYMYGFDSMEQSRERIGGHKQESGYYNLLAKDQSKYIRVLDRQFREVVKRRFYIDPQAGDMRVIPDNWDRNKIAHVSEKYDLQVIDRVVKRIRWRTTADNLVLHNKWSPLEHLTVVPYFPQFRDGRTIGVVEHLLGSQELLNKVTSQELHVVNTTANSGWKIKAGSLQNMTAQEVETEGAKTGLVLELEDVKDAEKIQPNTIPQGLERMSFKAEEYIKTISNVSDSLQGFDREDVAAKAIDAKAARGAVNFTKFNDSLERSDWILGRNIHSMVQAFYTEERVMNITHENLLGDGEELVVNQFDEATGALTNDLTVGEFEVVVTSVPHKASLEDAQFEHGLALRKEGIPIPDDVLIENSRLLNKADIAKRMADPANAEYEQKLKDLDLREKEASVTKLEAEAAQKKADAIKKTVEAAAIESGEGSGDEVDSEELKIKKYEIDQKMALERYAIDEKTKVEDRRIAADKATKRAEVLNQRAQDLQTSRTIN